MMPHNHGTEEVDRSLDDSSDQEISIAPPSTSLFASHIAQFKHPEPPSSSKITTPPMRTLKRSRPTDDHNISTTQNPPATKKKRTPSKYADPSKYAHLPPLTDILSPNLICVFVGNLHPPPQSSHAHTNPPQAPTPAFKQQQ
jgi:hypothetical protein